ncbi:MAG: RMD1 family protein [Desulfobulbaceae bacterium]|nr:MAG: RMD1 family protein [Desulfobulbaceae bacterium]
MPIFPLQGLGQFTGRALFAGNRLDLQSFRNTQRLAASPLTISAGANGVAVLFRFGVVVMFGLNAVEEAAFLSGITASIVEPFDELEAEEVTIAIDSSRDEHVDSSIITLQNIDITKLQIIADALAKSVVLGHYETTIKRSFDRVEPLASKLQLGKTYGHQSRTLLNHIGDVLMIQVRMVGRVEVSEKPELLWELPQYERLYADLEDNYELRERHLAIERKLELVSRTAETLFDLLHNKRSLRVEWYIVILIVFEILLTLYEMWVT